MTDLKCPYCPEVRPSRSRMADHMHRAHESYPIHERVAAVTTAREVEDVKVTSSAIVGVPVTLCVCGGELELDNDTSVPFWHHAVPMPKCRDAVPAAGMPTLRDRSDLAIRLDENGKSLDRAATEMAELKSEFDSIEQRLAKLDADLTKPSVVRRATLNQVWDRLVDKGHMAAAAEVMRMISRVVD